MKRYSVFCGKSAYVNLTLDEIPLKIASYRYGVYVRPKPAGLSLAGFFVCICLESLLQRSSSEQRIQSGTWRVFSYRNLLICRSH